MAERTNKKPNAVAADRQTAGHKRSPRPAQREVSFDVIMRARENPERLSPQDVLHLQQTLGNRATARLTGRDHSPGAGTIQRFAATVDPGHKLNQLPYGPSRDNPNRYSVFYEERNSYPHIHATEVLYDEKSNGKARFIFNQIHWSDGEDTTYWWTDTNKDNKWNPTFADGNRRRKKAPGNVLALAKEFTDILGGTLNETPRKPRRRKKK